MSGRTSERTLASTVHQHSRSRPPLPNRALPLPGRAARAAPRRAARAIAPITSHAQRARENCSHTLVGPSLHSPVDGKAPSAPCTPVTASLARADRDEQDPYILVLLLYLLHFHLLPRLSRLPSAHFALGDWEQGWERLQEWQTHQHQHQHTNTQQVATQWRDPAWPTLITTSARTGVPDRGDQIDPAYTRRHNTVCVCRCIYLRTSSSAAGGEQARRAAGGWYKYKLEPARRTLSSTSSVPRERGPRWTACCFRDTDLPLVAATAAAPADPSLTPPTVAIVIRTTLARSGVGQLWALSTKRPTRCSNQSDASERQVPRPNP